MGIHRWETGRGGRHQRLLARLRSLAVLKIESTGARLGNENFGIYALAAAQAAGSGNTVFRDDIPGNNGKYKSLPGYNLVLGNGTLFGGEFVRAPGLPVAGKPQTPINP
jgi:kumamolisin